MQHVDVVSELIESGCDPNIFDHDKRSPLTIASLQGQVEICQTLLDAGALINHADLGEFFVLLETVNHSDFYF